MIQPSSSIQETEAAASAFDYTPQTRVLFGPGTINRLGTSVEELGGKKVLLVTDQGLAEAGHEERAIDILQQAGLETHVFDGVQPNPTTDDVKRGLQVAQQNEIDIIVGLGGGSSMDCAKGINFLLTNGGEMKDYWGIGKATQPMLPMIAIPTTAGTGSEAQSFALIADATTHMKMACGDKKAACKLAILDPDLTASMPSAVAAATGIDGISHAVESYVTTKRTWISQLFARRAWSLLAENFLETLNPSNGVSANARGAMLVGAHLAGTAIENSMLGATHALANPLSAHYNLTHGVVIGVMLPHVIRYNAEVVSGLYAELAADVGINETDDRLAAEQLAERIQSFTQQAGLPQTLDQCGVESGQVPELAAEAAQQWTATFNPRPVNKESLEQLYRSAFSE